MNNTHLSARMRPANLEEVCGQSHIIGPDKILTNLLEKNSIRSLIFYGPSGTGKSTLAYIISDLTESEFLVINAVLSNIKEMREKIETGRQNRKMNKKTILFIDEIHRFNKSQQDALLPAIEESSIILIGSTTHNPNFYIIPALKSRVHLIQLNPLTEKDLSDIFEKALQDERGLAEHKIIINNDVKDFLIASSDGDGRKMLDNLEIAFLNSKLNNNGEYIIDLQCAENAVQKKLIQYDKDEDDHYDYISAFIKSVRGSDPDAAVYYLGRMLIAGEDPRFIARRLAILAAEDIGLAEPNALTIAASTLQIIEFIGMPEARIVLSECTLYLACSPKSNSAYTAIKNVYSDIEKGKLYSPPSYLTSPASSRHKKETDYKYPHDYPYHYVNQRYVNTDSRYYEPQDLGKEKEFKRRLEWIEKNLKKDES